jgi:hypothetical protein
MRMNRIPKAVFSKQGPAVLKGMEGKPIFR